MLAAQFGTKPVVYGPLFAVACGQHVGEKGTAGPVAPLHGHDVARTIHGVRMLRGPVPMRLE